MMYIFVTGVRVKVVCLSLRTLMKQGPYGGRPVVKKAVIITPSSLVKVSHFVAFSVAHSLSY